MGSALTESSQYVPQEAALRERMIEVYRASAREASAEAIDPLDARLHPVAGHARMFFTDQYSANPLLKYLKIAAKKFSLPFFDEQLIFNTAVRDLFWEMKHRIQQSEAENVRLRETIEALERRLSALEIATEREDRAPAR